MAETIPLTSIPCLPLATTTFCRIVALLTLTRRIPSPRLPAVVAPLRPIELPRIVRSDVDEAEMPSCPLPAIAFSWIVTPTDRTPFRAWATMPEPRLPRPMVPASSRPMKLRPAITRPDAARARMPFAEFPPMWLLTRRTPAVSVIRTPSPMLPRADRLFPLY